MKKIYYEREKIEQFVKDEIKNKFGDDDFTSINYYDLTKKDKQEWLEEYNKNLNYFHYIFNLGENGKVYLWNRFNSDFTGKEFPYDKNDFSEEELAFLKKASAVNRNDGVRNINKPIFTERLKLAPLSGDDVLFLRAKLKEGGVKEFENYTSVPYSEELVEYFFCDFPLIFGIYLEERIVGTIGFTEMRNPGLFNLEFYIVPEHRGKGYLQEALTKLLEFAFAGKLIVQEETIYDNVYEEVAAQINFIRISIRDNNERVVHLVKKFGASFDGRDRYATKLSDGYHDMLLFTIVNPNFKDRK